MSKYQTPNSKLKKRDLTSPEDCVDIKRNKSSAIMTEAMDTNTVTVSKPNLELTKDNMRFIASCLKEQFSSSVPLLSDEQFESLSNRMVESVMTKFDAKIKLLENENSSLRARVVTLESQVDAANQYSRRNSLWISGVAQIADTPLMERENTDTYVLKMCQDLGVPMTIDDIDRSHRTGKQRPSKPCDILVKFATYRARNRLYKARSSAKDKGYMDIYVNEDLTYERSRILFLARQLIKSKSLSQAWSHDGTILLKLLGSDTVHRVNTEAEFIKLCPAFVEVAAKFKRLPV